MRATSNKDSRLAEALKKQKQINTLISDLKGQISHEARREKRTLGQSPQNSAGRVVSFDGAIGSEF